MNPTSGLIPSPLPPLGYLRQSIEKPVNKASCLHICLPSFSVSITFSAKTLKENIYRLREIDVRTNSQFLKLSQRMSRVLWVMRGVFRTNCLLLTSGSQEVNSMKRSLGYRVPRVPRNKQCDAFPWLQGPQKYKKQMVWSVPLDTGSQEVSVWDPASAERQNNFLQVSTVPQFNL